ncbi:primase C-terminal domain-containing protein [Enterococcus sp. LJL90]
MIYKGKVIPSIMEEPTQKKVIEFFKDYQPITVQVPDDPEEQKKLKTMGVDGFIAGKMSARVRKNENLVYRDCLILDLDDVVVSEETLIQTIHKLLSDVSYVLYPTISHVLKGVRYRLVIPLDGAVKEADYKLLVRFFSEKLLKSVLKNVDLSNGTWSQIQLLPVFTQHVHKGQVIIHEIETPFPLSQTLETARNWVVPQTKGKPVKNLNQFKKGGSRYRNATTELFESLVSGGEVGNRNNRIAAITGGLLARAVNVTAVFELVKVANQYFDEPLPEEEVEETFFSISRKELGAD